MATANVRLGGEKRRCEIRVEVRPAWAFALPRFAGLDPTVSVRGGVLERLLALDGALVLARVAQLAPDRVLFGAQADSRQAAQWAIERMRFATGVDRDLREFHARFRHDPLIGAELRAQPGLRPAIRPFAFDALVSAVCGQLIEARRAAMIERALCRALGRRCERTGLRTLPDAQQLSRVAPARLESLGLSGARALTLVKAAREVASGRVDLLCESEQERGWRRLRRIDGIGSWTIQKLALHGQGRLDQIPAGDLAYLKLVGALRGGGRSQRASEPEVREFFAPYAPWAGLAGIYALRAAARRRTLW